MANSDLIRLLLQAELDTKSIENIKAGLKNIEKNNKPIEVKVVTDKAERSMIDFAKSMGIKLDKNLKTQFKGLSSSLLGDFDQSKFDDIVKGITDAYTVAMSKNSKKMQLDFFENTDDKKIYDYLNGSILKLDDSTVNAKKNVDGFNNALRGLVKTSTDSGLSLDQMGQELEGMGIKDLGANTEDIAERLAKAVSTVRDVRKGFVDLGNDVPKEEIQSFVQNELMGLLTNLGQIDFESRQAKKSLQEITAVESEFNKTNKVIDGVEQNIKEMGVVNRKTFKDMNEDVYKYIDTYKNLEKGITVSDTYKKNDQGGFDFSGRIVDNKSIEVTYKSLQKAHEEALKMNIAYDDQIVKNQKLLEQAQRRQEISKMTGTSDEIKKLNEYYKELEKSSAKEAQRITSLTEKVELYQQKMRGNMDIFADKNKGKFDEKQLDNLRTRMENLSVSSGNATREMREITIELGHMQKQATSSNGMLATITENMLKFARFYIVGQAIVNLRNSIKDGVESIKELDASLTELSKVSDLTETQLEEFTDTAYEAGRVIGRTGKEVIDATTEFKRAGYEINEAFELSQQALLLTNIGDGIDDVKEASSSLIAILKGFKMEANETAHVVDALNEVSNNYAVDTNNLTEIMKRASGTIGQTGTSYEQLLGLATGGYESLRNAEMVASGKIFCPYVQKCA